MTPIEITTQAQFGPALLATVHAAIARGARTMLWVDPDLTRWPLDDPGLIDALTGWLRQPQRRLNLLASDYEALARRHPRFAQWRTPWMHAIDARTPDEGPATDLPTLLLDDGPLLLTLWERDPPRGRAGPDAVGAKAARDRIDAPWQRSAPAWPSKPLGL
jgi:hypothetical protein